MKAISLWQPWASLVAIGAKRVETRSWATNYRGPLAIHAARTSQHLNDLHGNPHFHKVLAGGLSVFPLGDIVAVCDITDCVSTALIERADRNRTPELDKSISATLRFAGHSEAAIADALTAYDISDQERSFGDYAPGRYAWFLSNIRRIQPVRVTGRQGLFEVPDDLIEVLK